MAGEWKQSFRKIPDSIVRAIADLADDEFQVACVLWVKRSELAEGMYSHLGITLTPKGLKVLDDVLPSPENGKASRINLDGEEIVRKDLPKIEKTATWEAPSWGSYYRTHTMTRSYKAYQREFIPARGHTIAVEVLSERQREQLEWQIKFAVSQVFRRKNADPDELLFALNLLQENVGDVDVVSTTASYKDFTASVKVDWEILPPGTRDQLVKAFFKGKTPEPAEEKRFFERYQVLKKLDPKNWLRGASGFLRYFGAQFADDLVVFECLNYGNAAYVMYEDWETLSAKSRLELLKGNEGDFDRVIHTKGWEARIEELVRARRARR
jgi:hypothetical protein